MLGFFLAEIAIKWALASYFFSKNNKVMKKTVM